MESTASKPTSREWRVWSSDAHETAKRLTHDPELAGDLAQEALILLTRCYTQVRDLHNWLFVVIRRMVSKRSVRGRQRPSGENCYGWDSAGAFEDVDFKLDIEKAMHGLPPRQARILELALAGHSHAETARQLGCEVHQVGPRLQRAYRALGRRLLLEGTNEAG